MWQVVTESGLDVFSGSKPQCKAYIRQALKKGSEPGFLRIVKSGSQPLVTLNKIIRGTGWYGTAHMPRPDGVGVGLGEIAPSRRVKSSTRPAA